MKILCLSVHPHVWFERSHQLLVCYYDCATLNLLIVFDINNNHSFRIDLLKPYLFTIKKIYLYSFPNIKCTILSKI